MTNEELAKQYFKFPLRKGVEDVYVYTDDYYPAFNLLLNLNQVNTDKLIHKLNTGIGKLNNKFEVKGTTIRTIDGIGVLLVRSWGRLTGTGGYKLPDERAAEIQDAMLHYCCEQLNKD